MEDFVESFHAIQVGFVGSLLPVVLLRYTVSRFIHDGRTHP